MKWLKLMSVSLVASCTLMACGGEGNDKDNTQQNNNTCVGKCDSEEGTPACSGLVVDHNGRELSDGIIKGLDDPLARYVLRRGEACPTSFDEVMDKLRVEDSDGCDPMDRRAGIEASAISETEPAWKLAMPWASVVAHASRMQMATVFATMLTTAWVLTMRLMYAMGPVKPMLMKMGFVIPMKWLDVRILQRVILIH